MFYKEFGFTGFSIAQVMVENGLRMSTSRAYLRPAHQRPNLFVKIDSRATGLVLNRLNSRVQGVKYLDRYGVQHMVRARKEVILSAGVVGSAHLLLVSGIGPADDLFRAGVTLFQDLPVGRNLQHHVSVSIAATVNATEVPHYLTMDAVSQFLAKRTGLLASTGLTQTTGFLTTSYAVDGVRTNDFSFSSFTRRVSKSTTAAVKATARHIQASGVSSACRAIRYAVNRRCIFAAGAGRPGVL